MKRLKWIVITVTALALVAGTIGWQVVRSWLKSSLTADNIVQQIEAQWNCRASIKTLEASLSSSPARITLTSLALGPRDGEVGKPLAQRGPIGKVLILARTARLELDAADLLSGQVHIRKLAIDGLAVGDEVSPDGESQMKTMFAKAPSSAAAAAPAASSPKPKLKAPASLAPNDAAPVQLAGASPAVESAMPAKHAPSPLPFGILADEIVINSITTHLVNRVSKTTMDLNLDQVRVTDVDLDAGDLAHHNRCSISLTGRFEALDHVRKITLADITFSGTGEAHPFDVATGQIDPEAELSLILKKGSKAGGNSKLGGEDGKDKGIAKLKSNYGIDIADVPLGGLLTADTNAQARLHQGRFEFTKDVVAELPEYRVILSAASWIDTQKDDAELKLRLIPNETLAAQINAGASEKLGEGTTRLAAQLVFNDGEGHLAFDFTLAGRLSRLKFELGGTAGALKQLFEGLGGK